MSVELNTDTTINNRDDNNSVLEQDTPVQIFNTWDELNLNPDIINVNGGAISLGHPLGCTGAKLSVQLFEEMRLRKNKYGIVSMCVGTGQGCAGVYELL